MFREQIHKHYYRLSRSYRRVADFILGNYRAAAFMTAAAMADAVDVDTTTVVRFAQRIGYPGYPDLISDIQNQVKLELTRGYLASPELDSPQARIQQLVAQDRANLENVLAHNSLDALENLLDLLRAAPRILVLGESYAAPIAESFALLLRDAGLPAVFVSGDVYDRARALARLTRKDVVIGLTPLEGPSGVARALGFARDEGSITVACTPSLSSHAARSAEHLLYAPGETSGAPASLTALYALCMAIAQTVATTAPEGAARREDDINRALNRLFQGPV